LESHKISNFQSYREEKGMGKCHKEINFKLFSEGGDKSMGVRVMSLAGGVKSLSCGVNSFSLREVLQERTSLSSQFRIQL